MQHFGRFDDILKDTLEDGQGELCHPFGSEVLPLWGGFQPRFRRGKMPLLRRSKKNSIRKQFMARGAILTWNEVSFLPLWQRGLGGFENEFIGSYKGYSTKGQDRFSEPPTLFC